MDPARAPAFLPQTPLHPRERVLVGVLDDCLRALERAKIPHGLLGGLGSAALGRPRHTEDIDVFVRPEDADATLEALAGAGFRTERTNPHWIFKAFRDDVVVDVIFRAKRDIYLDEGMRARLIRTTFKGIPVTTIPAEDLIVIKAIIHDEDSPRHWYDAIGILAACELDWDYLLMRANAGVRRVLSLLVYAQSCDVAVPDSAIHKLIHTAYPL